MNMPFINLSIIFENRVHSLPSSLTSYPPKRDLSQRWSHVLKFLHYNNILIYSLFIMTEMFGTLNIDKID